MVTNPRTAVHLHAGWPVARTVKWGIVSSVALVISLVAGQYVRVVQAQAERSAVLSTLGALRTGLVIARLQGVSAVHAAPFGGNQSNPFTVLQTLPHNYRGEFSVTKSLVAPPGSWVYDPQCVCVGYVPLDTNWAEGTSQSATLWFKVGPGLGAPQLTAQGIYTWRGVLVQ